jgi:sensor histidine kinase YesM
MFIKKEEIKTFWIQVGSWMVVLVMPSVSTWFITHSGTIAWVVFKGACPFVSSLGIIFLLNVYWLAPAFFMKERKRQFYIYNVILTLFFALLLYALSYLDNGHKTGFVWSHAMIDIIVKWGICWANACLGQLVRTSMQQKVTKRQLKEERQKRVETELSMLKSQLNPHFLFNTLNNISSLVQIDADAAQESIGQLSDLLRYSLYDSNQKKMPIEREIEFMNNYIDLMRLRCNELTEVKVDMPLPERKVDIAPMLFISLIENAFKHGVNSRKPSFVHFSLHLNDDTLTFTSENSLFPKPDTDRIGSGVGIVNTQRRLDLVYPGDYSYIYEQRGNTYFAQITIKNCL